MKRVAWIYHPDYLLHTPPFEHPESPERLVAITDHLGGAGLIDRMVPVTPEYPEDADILSVHDREYLDRLENACRRGDLTLDSEDTYLNRHSFNIALLSAGGAIAGAKAVGMGFCLLNNAAIAARYLQARHGVGKVLIVDWDVHHGNGTQNIFLEDPTVFYFSIHEHPTFLYPGTGRRWEIGKGKGEGATLNAPMAPGAGDAEYRTVFEQTLEPAVERFRPEIILVSAGFDAHRDDPLADLQVTEEGFRFMTRHVLALADRFCGGKVVSILEGGYETSSLTSCIEIHVRELLGD
jgi:acetoin utilization deacetylase AcuC-like enzyme